MKNKKKPSSPTRIPLVQRAITYPFMDMEVEYDDDTQQPRENGKAEVARSNASQKTGSAGQMAAVKNKNADNVPPTRIPLVRATITHPIIELELEYEDDAPVEVQVPQTNKPKRPDLAKNGKPKAARSKARKKKPARRGKAR